MMERNVLEASLLAEISRRTKEISETQHELARQQRILSRAATLLRLGKGAPRVLAEIREQCPDLLQEYCDLQVDADAAASAAARPAAGRRIGIGLSSGRAARTHHRPAHLSAIRPASRHT